MVFKDELLQSLLQDVRVDLSGGDVGMAKQLLHGTQVRAAVQQMAGESMPQHMRRDALGLDASFEGEPLQLLRQALAREMALRAARGKQPLAGNPAYFVAAVRADCVEIAVESAARRRRQGHHALAPAFTLDGENAAILGEHRARQCDEL